MSYSEVAGEYPYGPPAADAVAHAAGVARLVMEYGLAVTGGEASLPEGMSDPEVVEQTLAVADYRRDRAVSGSFVNRDCPMDEIGVPIHVHVVMTTEDLPEDEHGVRHVPDPLRLQAMRPDAPKGMTYSGDEDLIRATEDWVQVRLEARGLAVDVEFSTEQRRVVASALQYTLQHGRELWMRREARELALATGVHYLSPALAALVNRGR